MKISYRLVSGGGYTTLCDETAGAAIQSEFQPSFNVQVQEDMLWNGPSEYRQARGNVKCVLPIVFNQAYSSRANSIAAVRTMAGLLNVKLHLQVTEGGEIQYYPNAVAMDYRYKAGGVSADHSFTFNADNVTNTAP